MIDDFLNDMPEIVENEKLELIDYIKQLFTEKKTYAQITQLVNRRGFRNLRGKPYKPDSLRLYCVDLITLGMLPSKVHGRVNMNRNLEIIDAYTKGGKLKKIAEKFYVKESVVRHVLKHAGVYRSLSDVLIKRNKVIVDEFKRGVTHKELCGVYNLTRQAIYNICKEAGVSKKSINKEKYGPIVDRFNVMLNDGMCLKDVSEIIRAEGYNLQRLQYNGLNYDYKGKISKRNKKIIELYTGGMTAKEIADSGSCGVTNFKSIYRVINNCGVVKFPKIKRGYKEKGLFEDKKLMKRIIHLKEVDDCTFVKIAEVLEAEGFKSVMGKLVTQYQVRHKYIKYNKLNPIDYKIREEKRRAKKIKSLEKELTELRQVTKDD